MKRLPFLCCVFLGVIAEPGIAQVTNVIGYYNRPFDAGDNLFENALSAEADDHLSTLFARLATPEHTTISLWNPASQSFDTTSEFVGGTWSIDLELAPGTGARLTTSSPFMGSFVGRALDHTGSPLTDAGNPLPPVFSGPSGTYLLADKSPMIASGTDIFFHILGRAPNPGEQFTRLDSKTQTYITSTYLGGGNWDIVPSLGIGEAAFFTIPEPSGLALLVIGLLLSCASKSVRG